MTEKKIDLSKLGIDTSPKNLAIVNTILDQTNAFVYHDHGETVNIATILQKNKIVQIKIVDLHGNPSERDVWSMLDFYPSHGAEMIPDISKFSEWPGRGPQVVIAGFDTYLEHNHEALAQMATDQAGLMNALKLAEKYSSSTVVACDSLEYDGISNLADTGTIAKNFLLDFAPIRVIR